MEELELIIQRMIDSGETEENIKLVIQNYNTDEPAKIEAVATETAPVTAVEEAEDTDLDLEDTSSELQEPESEDPSERDLLVSSIEETERQINDYIQLGGEVNESDAAVLQGYKNDLFKMDQNIITGKDFSSDEFEKLEDNEKIKLQEAASNEIQKQYSSDGVVEFEITPEEIDDKAKKILKEKTQPSLIESYAAQTVRGFASFAKNSVDFVDMVEFSIMEAGLNAFDSDYEGTPEEKQALMRTAKQSKGAVNFNHSLAAELFIQKLEPSIRKYENESIIDDIEQGNYLLAGERAVGSALESLPSVAAAYLGVGGLVALGGSSAGAKFTEEFEKDPSVNTANLVANALASGTIEAGFEIATRGVLKRAGILANKGNRKAAEDLIRGGSESLVKKLGINTVSEAGSEAATKTTTLLLDALPNYTGVGLSREFDLSKDWKSIAEEGIVGSVFGIAGTTGGAVKNRNVSAVRAAEYILMPDEIKQVLIKSSNDLSELYKNKKTADVESLELIDDAIDEKISIIVDIKSQNSNALKNMTSEEVKAYAKNKLEINSLNAKIKNPKTKEIVKNLAEKKLKQIKEVNKDLFRNSNERMFERRNKAASDLAKDLGFKKGPQVFNSTEDYIKAISENTGMSLEEAATEAKGSNGAFVGAGEIFVDKTVALKQGSVSVSNHEVLHPILNAVLGDIQNQSRIVKEFKEQLNSSQLNWVQSQLDANVETQDHDKEFLTYFSEGILNKDIKYDENVFTKLKKFVTNLFKAQGYKNISFKSGEDVFEFLKQYNNSILKNDRVESSIVEAIRNQETERGVKSSEVGTIDNISLSKTNKEQLNALQEELDALDEFDFDDEFAFDAAKSNLKNKIKTAERIEAKGENQSIKKPTVKKEGLDKEAKPKKVYNNEKLIETIKSKDTSSKEKAAAEADLVDSFDTMALNAIKYDTRKGDYDRTRVRDYLRGFFPTILKSYNPSEAKFSTWVYNNIAPKAQQTYEKFKKIAETSLDAEAGTTGSVKEVAADTSSSTEVAADKTSRKIKPIELVRDPELKKKYREAIKNIVESGEVSIDDSTFGNLKDLAAEVTAEIFDIPILKVTDPADNLAFKDIIVDDSNIDKVKKYYPDAKVGMIIKSESSKIQDIIKSMGNDLFKLLPPENVSPELATVDAQAYKPVKGTGLKIPSSLMKVFYEATGKRSKGVTSQTAIKRLKPGLTYEQFLKDLGIVKGQPNAYDRAIGQRLKAITTLFGKLATNTEVRQLEGVTDIQKQNIEAGKSGVMFSKSIDTVIKQQEIKNNLGLEPGSNQDSLLEIQFSKKKRAEYENILKKNRPELEDIPKQVENLFKWADNLNVPDNKKPKYKKLALYYTSNGYTIFPEDGYKIEEVIRLSDKNKIDPYAYPNPDELINKFTEVVKAAKINPDNVPELSNKQELKDGVVVYDVKDSRKGQRAVRNIVDSFWGEKAQPWCLIARDYRIDQKYGEFDNEIEAYEFAEKYKGLGWEVEFYFDEKFSEFDVRAELFTDDESISLNGEAWEQWKLNNNDGRGAGYKIAFQNGKLLSFRDGGKTQDVSEDDYYYEPQTEWWDRFDKPTEDLVISLGVDKATGYKIIGSMDSRGNVDISGYGEGDFMSRKNSFTLYDADKNIIRKEVWKDGKPVTRSTHGRIITSSVYSAVTKNNYINGQLKSSTYIVKDLKTGEIVTKSSKVKTELLATDNSAVQREGFFIEESEVIGKYGTSPSLPNTTVKEITGTTWGGNAALRGIITYYQETITDGVKVVSVDRRAELEKVKKSYASFSKSVNEASKSNNKMLPESQRLKGDFTNQDVLNKMRELDDKQREAQISFSKKFDLNKDFNDIIENKTGIAAGKIYGKVKGEVVGASKGKFNFFISPTAEDFVGLLYKTLGKGSKGDAQMAWYKKHLLDPFAQAMNNVSRDRNTAGRDFRALKKKLKIVPKDLKKKLPGEYFTREQAIRVYIWEQIGADIPGLSEADRKTLVDMVKDDANLILFANEVMKINKGISYAKPTDSWVSGTITTDLIEGLNKVKRKQYLELWQQNVDEIFSTENMNKLEAAYGASYRYALSGTLERMKTGRNRTFGTDSLTGRFLDWINGTTGAIMFFNTRSAVLQTISAANFINFQDNNVFAASKAFANQKQYWSDFKMLFNSDFLVERRDGLKLNVQESDIADIAKERGARGVIGRILKLGFTPTQLADSFAIAAGGSTFYRNRLNKLIKEGMDPLAAKKQAMRDFRETAEESQQSSRPDKISQQQAGPLGRTVLAFANTPAQYARLMKKAASDIKNGRGDFKTNVSKIMYYGFVQNLIFNTLTNALFAIEFGEDEEEESKKYVSVANGMADSILRGIGVSGAIISVLKNAALTFVREDKKKNPNYEKITDDLLRISPPIASKISKIKSASRSYKWDKKEMGEKGFSLDSPAYLAGANVVSAATNLPLDRVIKKMDHVRAASNSELETYKRIFLLAGWSKWDLGIKEPKKSKKKNGKFGGGGGFGSGGKF